MPILKERIQNDQAFRINLALDSFYWFSHIYFPHYLGYKTPDFHREIYQTLEGNVDFLELLAFRESAKSTITALFYPVWEVLRDRYHFILLCSYSGQQVKQLFQNVKIEFENNKFLNRDFGPFPGAEEWTSEGVIIPRYDTKIVGRSSGSSSRGLRYKQYRPDLAVFDDIEEDEAMRTQERRDNLDYWFRSVMMPACSDNSKKILSGSLLHKDSVMQRIREEIKGNKRDGKLLEFPLYVDNPVDNLWKSKYPDKEAVMKKKREVGKETIWQREYLLKIVSEEGQIVTWDDIRWYKEIPKDEEIIRRVIAVDLAISEKETADFTGIVVMTLTHSLNGYKIYCEDYVNERMGFEKTLERIDNKHSEYPNSIVLIEDIAYQRAAIETLQNERSYPVYAISFKGDKRSRLETVSPPFKKNQVHFKEGQQGVVSQIVNLGVEKHDDLCDATVYAVYDLMRHLSNASLQEEEEEKPIMSGLLDEKF